MKSKLGKLKVYLLLDWMNIVILAPFGPIEIICVFYEICHIYSEFSKTSQTFDGFKANKIIKLNYFIPTPLF